MAEFGPNQAVIERFLDRIEFLGDHELLQLSAAWQATGQSRRRLAWRSVQQEARRAGLEPALRRAQSAIVSWSNRRSPVMATTFVGSYLAGDQMRADIARHAVPALVDAVGALVMRGPLLPEEFDTLWGPFGSIEEETAPA